MRKKGLLAPEEEEKKDENTEENKGFLSSYILLSSCPFRN